MKLVPSWPLVGKELIEQAARRGTYVTRAVYALLLFSIFLLAYLSVLRMRDYSMLYVLGAGEELFQVVVGLQFAGIYFFLPAMMSGVITREKERQSMALLLLTGLGPMNILMEKYIGRLIPMTTFLLLSLPLLAVSYMLGGVTMDAIGSAVYMLLLTCLQVGALALFFSTWCRTSVSAFVSTYLWGLVFFFGPAIAAEAINEVVIGRWIEPEVYACHITVYVYVDTLRDSFDRTLLRSIPIWATIVLFLGLSRRYFLRRAFLPARSRMLQGFRRLDGVMGAVNRRLGGVVLGDGGAALPESEPVAWREATQRLLGRANYLARLGILIEVPLILLMLWMMEEGNSYGRQYEEMSAIAIAIWSLAALAVVVQSGNTIVTERVNGTLDVLATTPMTGREIILQKMRGVWRMMFVFAVPLMTVVLFEGIWESSGGGWDPWDEDRYRTDMLAYSLGTLLTLAIYLPMLAWGSLWISLRSRSRARAIVTALVILVVWMAVMPFFIGVFAAFDIVDANDPPAIYGFLLSPASMVLFLEFWEMRHFEAPPWVPILMNAALHALVLVWLRLLCLTHADRYLGRAPARPEWQTG